MNRESKIQAVVGSICWKNEWRSKIYDPRIVSKWQSELKTQGVDEHTFKMALDICKSISKNSTMENDYCQTFTKNEEEYMNDCYDSDGNFDEELHEIRYEEKSFFAKEFCSHEYSTPPLKKFVQETSEIFDDEIRTKLSDLLKPLESKEDWHPDSNKQVLDLIHPSLYCYVRGVSQLLDKKLENSQPISEENKYQWLPSEFEVSRSADGVVSTKIASYINNLNFFEHQELYGLTEQMFSRILPYFEKVIDKRLVRNLETKPLQVITKAANIILTPDNPIYPGGSWHLEGMPYEHIIATGIYYYEETNLTDSFLEFRRALEDLLHYPQDGHEYVKKHYGMKNDDPLNEYLGKIRTSQGKCLFFPNYLQHHVAPFELLDKSQTGFRKIFVFFLIDPDYRIISTKDVPIQQEDYLTQKMDKLLTDNTSKDILSKIIHHSPTMTLEEAQKYRKELMFQRKYFTDKVNKSVFERPFSLCEH